MPAIHIDTHITAPAGTDVGAAPPAETRMQVSVASLTLDAVADALDEARRQVNVYTTGWKDVLGPAEAKKQAERKAALQTRRRAQDVARTDNGGDDEEDADEDGNDEEDE